MCGLLPNRELDEAIKWGVEILRVVSKGTKGGLEFYCESRTMGTFPRHYGRLFRDIGVISVFPAYRSRKNCNKKETVSDL